MQEGTDELLDILSRHSSGRELTVAVQEVAEFLVSTDENGSGDEPDQARATTATQFVRLLNVYTRGTTRLAFR